MDCNFCSDICSVVCGRLHRLSRSSFPARSSRNHTNWRIRMLADRSKPIQTDKYGRRKLRAPKKAIIIHNRRRLDRTDQCEAVRRGRCCLHLAYCRMPSVPESLLQADVREAENSCHRQSYTRPVCRWFPSCCLQNVEPESSTLQLLDLSYPPKQRE